ncbi:MAG: hypothetical protein JO323_09240, partial [Acidobacteriia bacterium]|nr:hypothetical protein [Terriglobia bacterium]
FYAESTLENKARQWLTGSTLWQDFERHLASNGVSVYRFDEGKPAMSDTERAVRFIHDLEQRFGTTGADLPQLLYLALPGSAQSTARPEEGYPYAESAAADNDYALGKVLEYLSTTKSWKQMAVFIVDANAGDGVDHIDVDRAPALCAGPWAKRNSVAHENIGLAGILKTVSAIFHTPNLNLSEASASLASGCFQAAPDTEGYRLLQVDKRIYDPERAKP